MALETVSFKHQRRMANSLVKFAVVFCRQILNQLSPEEMEIRHISLFCLSYWSMPRLWTSFLIQWDYSKFTEC